MVFIFYFKEAKAASFKSGLTNGSFLQLLDIALKMFTTCQLVKQTSGWFLIQEVVKILENIF